MDYNLIKLAAASFFLGLLVAYLFWIKVRVIRLRQHLFEIRDDMWDAAQKLGQLDDPGHRAYRHVINAIIYSAGTITPITLAYAVMGIKEAKLSVPEVPRPMTPELDAIVAKARERVTRRIWKYLSFETLTGLVLSMMVWIIPKRIREADEKVRVSQALQPIPAMSRHF